MRLTAVVLAALLATASAGLDGEEEEGEEEHEAPQESLAYMLNRTLMTLDAAPWIEQFQVRFRITDIESVDESRGAVSAFVAMEMVWEDERWAWAAGLWCALHEGEPSAAAACADGGGSLLSPLATRRSAEFFRQADDLQRELLDGSGASGAAPWTPIPPQLFPSAESSMTRSEPFVGLLEGVREKPTFHAVWFDFDPTVFRVDMDYTFWPFDSQELELCLPDMPYWPEPVVDHALGMSPIRDGRQSDVSGHIHEAVVEHFRKDGFTIRATSPRKEMRGFFWRLCWRVDVVRQWEVITIRFFLPMAMLLFIPFTSFWLTVSDAMPRITTGFVSFLALTVFRNLAFEMLPTQSSKILWIDVTLLSVNEVLFLCVIQNIVSQRLHASVSNFASERFDRICRVSFPLTAALLLVLLFWTGIAHVDPVAILVSANALVLGMVAVIVVLMARFIWHLPENILHNLMQQLISEEVLWHQDVELDPRELSVIFQMIDKDRSGFVTPDEISAVFEGQGFTFESDQERADFHEAVEQACLAGQRPSLHKARGSISSASSAPPPFEGDVAVSVSTNTVTDVFYVDFEGFSTHIREFFGRKILQRIQRARRRQPKRRASFPRMSLSLLTGPQESSGAAASESAASEPALPPEPPAPGPGSQPTSEVEM